MNIINREKHHHPAYPDPTASEAINNVTRSGKQPQSVAVIRQNLKTQAAAEVQAWLNPRKEKQDNE